MADKVQKVSSPLGIASLCIGIAGCCIGAIPYLGLIAIPLGGIGFILAVVGFLISIIGRKSTIGFQFAGGIICVIAMFFSYYMSYSAHMAVGRMLGLVDENWNVIDDYSSAKKEEDNSESVSLTPTSENNSQSVTVSPSAKPNDGISTSGMTQNELFELAIKRNKENREREKEMERRGANMSSTTAPAPVVSTPPASEVSKPEPAVTPAPAIAKTEPVATPDSSNTEPSEKWYDASKEGILIGDIEVKIKKVAIGKVVSVGIMGDSEYKSKDDYLQVYLSVRNNNPHKKHDVRSWGHNLYYGTSSNNEAITLVDNYDNTYDRSFTQDTNNLKEGYISASLYPNKSIDDIAVFEVPVDGIEYLRLKLSVKWVDNKEEGFYRFQIPASMIQRQ